VAGPVAWTNNNRLVSLTDLPLRVYPKK